MHIYFGSARLSGVEMQVTNPSRSSYLARSLESTKSLLRRLSIIPPSYTGLRSEIELIIKYPVPNDEAYSTIKWELASGESRPRFVASSVSGSYKAIMSAGIEEYRRTLQAANEVYPGLRGRGNWEVEKVVAHEKAHMDELERILSKKTVTSFCHYYGMAFTRRGRFFYVLQPFSTGVADGPNLALTQEEMFSVVNAPEEKSSFDLARLSELRERMRRPPGQ